MKRPIILIDVDETVNNLVEEWTRCLNDKYSLSVAKSDIKNWDMKKTFHSLSDAEIYEPLNTPDLYKKLIPCPDSQEVIKTLIYDGFIIKFVTATHYKNVQYKVEWLNKYFPFVGWNNIIVTQQKQFVLGDIMIDDGLHNLSPLRKLNLLLDKPWNQGQHGDFTRVYNWQDIQREIYEYTQK